MTLEPPHPSQMTHLILITSFISSSTAHVFTHHPSTVMFSCRPLYNVLKCVINISHKVVCSSSPNVMSFMSFTFKFPELYFIRVVFYLFILFNFSSIHQTFHSSLSSFSSSLRCPFHVLVMCLI